MRRHPPLASSGFRSQHGEVDTVLASSSATAAVIQIGSDSNPSWLRVARRLSDCCR
jgi:hypothetical protein